jgi:hypothetical protein
MNATVSRQKKKKQSFPPQTGNEPMGEMQKHTAKISRSGKAARPNVFGEMLSDWEDAS